MSKDRQPTPKPSPDDKANKERATKEQDDYLEEALEETFPASDPIAPGHPQRTSKDRQADKPAKN